MSDERNPFTGAAEDVFSGRVTDGLDFLAARVVSSGDPEGAFAEDFVRACAVAPEVYANEIRRKLKKKFPSLNVRDWSAAVKDARAALLTAAPSTLQLSTSGTPRPNLANAIIQLRHSKLAVAWDSFARRVTHTGPAPWGPVNGNRWGDLDDIKGSEFLQHKNINCSTEVVNDAATALAHEIQMHPVREYLEGLKWDGDFRLDEWLPDCLGCRSDRYTRSIGAKFMISAVARVMQPGCKADHVLVLEGPQGAKKSSALRALCNGHLETDPQRGVQWFTDHLPDLRAEDVGQSLQGVWIIEFAELDAIRKQDWSRIKGFLSQQSDRYRRKYGRNTEDYPRQCIFVGSTNEEHWASDSTGARRFWPVPAPSIDTAKIIAMRDQLWAEAFARYQEGEKWWLTEDVEVLAREEQAERFDSDPWCPTVSRWLDAKEMEYSEGSAYQFDGMPYAVTVEQVLTGALDLKAAMLNMADKMRMGRLLRRLGWKATGAGQAYRRIVV